jgi:hypothetical protein
MLIDREQPSFLLAILQSESTLKVHCVVETPYENSGRSFDLLESGKRHAACKTVNGFATVFAKHGETQGCASR